MDTPSALMAISSARIVSVSVISTLSVTSSSSRWGARPDQDSASRTMVAMSPAANWAGERFTATLSSSGHCRAVRQASRNTQRPISWMRPVDSAIGMNSAGETGLPLASVMRSSASKPLRRSLTVS